MLKQLGRHWKWILMKLEKFYAFLKKAGIIAKLRCHMFRNRVKICLIITVMSTASPSTVSFAGEFKNKRWSCSLIK